MYHRLIHHFHQFIPNPTIATTYEKVLQKNPVSPYLDSREDFITWVHHIHNVINIRLDKPTITLQEHYDEFLKHFETKPDKLKRLWQERTKILFTIAVLGILMYIWYNKNVLV